MTEIRFKSQRFSVPWTRILPEGTGKETSKGNKGFKYNIYDSKQYFYKKFMVHGEKEHGNLRKGDKGISFLYNGKARNFKLSLER